MWNRLLNRAARELVTRAGVAPARFGYRFLPLRQPRDFEYELIDPPEAFRAPLPCNVATRDELPRRGGRWYLSMYDVPDRMLAGTFIATIPNCRVVTAADEWGDPHYAIVTGDASAVQVRGTTYDPAMHARLLASVSRAVRIEEASWILEQWDRNYAHWLMWHLPKLFLLRQHRPDLPVILPRGSRLAPVVARSIEMAGIRDVIELPASVVEIGRLTIIGMDDLRPSLMRRVRESLPPPRVAPSRRIFITRTKAGWRRLRNEDECWELLRGAGFERIVAEDLSFDEQIELVRETAVLFGAHGAGLANMIFATEGLDIIEISDDAAPDAHYYGLASALGHRYWLLHGRPEGDLRPGYHDVSVDVAAVARVIAGISRK